MRRKGFLLPGTLRLEVWEKSSQNLEVLIPRFAVQVPTADFLPWENAERSSQEGPFSNDASFLSTTPAQLFPKLPVPQIISTKFLSFLLNTFIS